MRAFLPVCQNEAGLAVVMSHEVLMRWLDMVANGCRKRMW